MVQDTPSRYLDKIVVRLPDGLKERIKDAATANKRSVNQELVTTLEAAYPEPDPRELASSMIDLMNKLFEIRSKSGATEEEATRIKRAYDQLISVGKELGSPESEGFDANVTLYRNKHLLAEIELVEALIGDKIAAAEDLKIKLQKSILED